MKNFHSLEWSNSLSLERLHVQVQCLQENEIVLKRLLSIDNQIFLRDFNIGKKLKEKMCWNFSWLLLHGVSKLIQKLNEWLYKSKEDEEREKVLNPLYLGVLFLQPVDRQFIFFVSCPKLFLASWPHFFARWLPKFSWTYV